MRVYNKADFAGGADKESVEVVNYIGFRRILTQNFLIHFHFI